MSAPIYDLVGNITVRQYSGTYIARLLGKTASCTAGMEQAAQAVAFKVLAGKPYAITKVTDQTWTAAVLRQDAKQPPICPKCGQSFDPTVDAIIACPKCGDEGSTACCNSAGRGVPCVECEEGGDPQ